MVTLMPTMAYGGIIGSIVGLIWAMGLDARIGSGIVAGAITGAAVGLVLGIVGKAASAGGRVSTAESAFVSGSLIMLFGMAAAGLGLVVWIIRAIV